MRTKKLLLFILVFMMILQTAKAEETHDHKHHQEGHIHFVHPLITEPPIPDNKVRLNYQYLSTPGEDGESGKRISTIEAGFEYAFTPSWGVEFAIPYSIVKTKRGGGNEDNFDNAEIALKYANHHFADNGLILGGGLELGLPTGNSRKDIGSSHAHEIEPFISGAYAAGSFEAIGALHLGFPRNKNGENEADTDLGWNLAFTRKQNDNLSWALELQGEHVNGGEEDGLDVINAFPSISYSLKSHQDFIIAGGIGFPLSNDREFYVAPTASVIRHF